MFRGQTSFDKGRSRRVVTYSKRETAFEAAEQAWTVEPEGFAKGAPTARPASNYPAILSMKPAMRRSRSVTPSASCVVSRTSTRL
jgi:hypothetical protein